VPVQWRSLTEAATVSTPAMVPPLLLSDKRGHHVPAGDVARSGACGRPAGRQRSEPPSRRAPRPATAAFTARGRRRSLLQPREGSRRTMRSDDRRNLLVAGSRATITQDRMPGICRHDRRVSVGSTQPPWRALRANS
jgi:hypothetical protein